MTREEFTQQCQAGYAKSEAWRDLQIFLAGLKARPSDEDSRSWACGHPRGRPHGSPRPRQVLLLGKGLPFFVGCDGCLAKIREWKIERPELDLP